MLPFNVLACNFRASFYFLACMCIFFFLQLKQLLAKIHHGYILVNQTAPFPWDQLESSPCLASLASPEHCQSIFQER